MKILLRWVPLRLTCTLVVGCVDQFLCPQKLHINIYLRGQFFFSLLNFFDKLHMLNIAVFALRKSSTLTCLEEYFHINLPDYTYLVFWKIWGFFSPSHKDFGKLSVSSISKEVLTFLCILTWICKLDITQYYITSLNFISRLCLLKNHVLYFYRPQIYFMKAGGGKLKTCFFSTLQEYT